MAAVDDPGRMLRAYSLIGGLHNDLMHAEAVAARLVAVICEDNVDRPRMETPTMTRASMDGPHDEFCACPHCETGPADSRMMRMIDARYAATVTVQDSDTGFLTILDVDPPDAVAAQVSMDLLRDIIAGHNEALGWRLERDAAQRECAELRANLESWDRLYSGAIGMVIDEGEERAGHKSLAWRTWSEYANGRTTIHTDPPESEITLCSLTLLRNMTAEHNEWKTRALHAEGLLDNIARDAQ